MYHATMQQIEGYSTFDLGLAASILAALMTCGQSDSICPAAILTIFTPSSLLDIEHAKLATCLNCLRNNASLKS